MSARRETAAVVGAGAAACAVCCAGPILGFAAAIGLGTAGGWALFGLVGLVVALAVGVVLVLRRRRRRPTCAPPLEQIVELGGSRTPAAP